MQRTTTPGMHYIFDLVFSAYEINAIGNSLITF